MTEMRKCNFEDCGHVTERENFLDHLIEVHGYRLVQTLSDLVEEEEEEIDLIAGGYEWECPDCEALNKEIEIPSDGHVKCVKCGSVYKVSDYHHAQE